MNPLARRQIPSSGCNCKSFCTCSTVPSRGFALSMATLFVGVVMFITAIPSFCHGEEGDDLPKVLRAGFLARIVSDVDPRDAQATIELLTREVSRNMGLRTSPKVTLFTSTKSMIEAYCHGDLDMVSMPTIDYMRLRNTVSMIPAFVARHNNGVGTQYALITCRDSGIKSIAGLKGKTLIMPPVNKHEAGHLWLNVLLRENPATFFHQLKEFAKQNQAIMGVFFRQADGALVTRAGLDAARQLNPQLDQRLLVIAESSNLSDGVTCFPPTTSEKTRRVLSNAINLLSSSDTGRQLFMIFQTNGVVPFNPVYLEGLETLLKEQRRLKIKATTR